MRSGKCQNFYFDWLFWHLLLIPTFSDIFFKFLNFLRPQVLSHLATRKATPRYSSW